MSLQWKKILEKAEELQKNLLQNPTYENAMPSSKNAVKAIKSAYKKAQIAEGVDISSTGNWQIVQPVKTTFGASYTLATELKTDNTVGKPISLREIKAVRGTDKVGLMNKLFHEGIVAKRTVLKKDGRQDIEYALTQEGYETLEKQEKAKNASREQRKHEYSERDNYSY
jgi:hypothetical protein